MLRGKGDDELIGAEWCKAKGRKVVVKVVVKNGRTLGFGCLLFVRARNETVKVSQSCG